MEGVRMTILRYKPARRLVHEEHAYKQESAREHLQGKWHAPFSRIRRASYVEGDAVVDEKGQTYTSHIEKLLLHVSRLMQSSGVDNTYHAPNAASSDRPPP